MYLWDRYRALFVFGPIALLIALGLWVSLRSGVVALKSGQDARRLAVNFTSVALRVVGYIAGLLAVQRIIGFPMDFGF